MSQSPTNSPSPLPPNLPPPVPPLAVPAARPANDHEEGEEPCPNANERGNFQRHDIQERGEIDDSQAILGTLQQVSSFVFMFFDSFFI